MDLRKLQYFSRVAESESFREAAERANVAQSALSRHVGALENELGVSLFERNARGVESPTARPIRCRFCEQPYVILR